MYSALTDRVPKLSMTEDDIKLRAQSLTDTDLQDKQNGRKNFSLSLSLSLSHSLSILVAMFSALTGRVPKISITEDEIRVKLRAQSLTVSDLLDKKNGNISLFTSLSLSVYLFLSSSFLIQILRIHIMVDS